MFGKGKYKAPVGAAEKLAMAQKLRETIRAGALAGGGKAKTYSQTTPVTIIFVLAVVIAMLMTDGSNSLLAGWHPTGLSSLDRLLTGSEIPHMTGDGDMDRLAVIFIRGGALFLFTGLFPLAALMTLRLSGGRLNPLIACWLMLVILPVALYFSKDILLPAISDILSGF